MNIKINCQDLQDSLSVVTRAIPIRPPQKIYEGVLIQSNDNNQVIITCSDSNLTIRSSINADVENSGAVVLPGRFFSELIRKMPLSEISLSSKEDNKVQIKCMSSNSSIMGMNAFEFPEMGKMNKVVQFEIPQKQLKEMINKTSFALSTDENKPVFTGSLMELSNNEIRLVALDGFRIAIQIYPMEINIPEGNDLYKVIVPGKMIQELGRILQDNDHPCIITINNKSIKVEFDNIEVLSVLISGEFIDYRKIIPKQFKSYAEIDKTFFQESIERASLLAKEGKNNTIRMKMENNHLRIMSHAEMGELNEDMNIQFSGDPLDIAFNSKYLSEIIKNIPEEKIFMNFNSNVSPCVINNVEKNDYIYMVLPMRVN